MNTTPNLSLTTYDMITDASSVLIYNMLNQISGSGTTQNLGIIDAFAGTTSASLVSLSASAVTAATRTSNTHSAVIQIVAQGTDVDTTTGLFYLRAPSELDGLVLYRAQGFLNTAGLTGSNTIQVRNMTKYAGNDALTVPITIASGDVVGVVGTVDANYDDVSTDDLIKIYVTGYSTTKGQGCQVILEYAYPV